MPNLAGWRAGLLLLLLLLMLLLKPYIALVALYCCIVALYSFILAPYGITNLVSSVFTTRQPIKVQK